MMPTSGSTFMIFCVTTASQMYFRFPNSPLFQMHFRRKAFAPPPIAIGKHLSLAMFECGVFFVRREKEYAQIFSNIHPDNFIR